MAAPFPPIFIDLPDSRHIVVTYEELRKHAEGREVAAVTCVSRSYTTVQHGGNQMPDIKHLYTGAPSLIHLWPGDSMEFGAWKPGGVTLQVLLPVYVAE